MVRSPPAKPGDLKSLKSIAGWGRSPEEAWQPTQDSCLENLMDRGAWRATAHGAAESDTPERLSTHSVCLVLRWTLDMAGLVLTKSQHEIQSVAGEPGHLGSNPISAASWLCDTGQALKNSLKSPGQQGDQTSQP